FFSTCALGSSGLRCWGQIGWVPQDIKFPQDVAVGSQQACAVVADKSIRCWSARQGSRPDQEWTVSGATDMKQIAASGNSFFAVSQSGEAMCWNSAGVHEYPVPSDLGPVKAIAIGGESKCAITVAGFLRCWGADDHGSLDNLPNNFSDPSEIVMG